MLLAMLVEHLSVETFLEVFGTGCVGGVVGALAYLYAYWKKRQK
jgi:hypothetical protein